MFQFAGIALAEKLPMCYLANDPILRRQLVPYRTHGFVFKVGFGEVDSNHPAGRGQAFDCNTMGVFPEAIALPLIPVLHESDRHFTF
jgi:hypothetical protein